MKNSYFSFKFHNALLDFKLPAAVSVAVSEDNCRQDDNNQTQGENHFQICGYHQTQSWDQQKLSGKGSFTDWIGLDPLR